MTVSGSRFLNQLKVYMRSVNDKQLIKEWYYFLQKFPELFININLKTSVQNTKNIAVSNNIDYSSNIVKMKRDKTESNTEDKNKSDDKHLEEIEIEKTPVSGTDAFVNQDKDVFVYNTSLLESLKQKLSMSEVKVVKKDEGIPTWRKNTPVSKSGILYRTKHLLVLIDSAQSIESKVKRLEDFVSHLKQYPEARLSAIKEKAIHQLLHIRHKVSDHSVQRILREAFALLGHVDPLPRKGIRILSIDGGGIRGVAVITMLKKLEDLTGKKIYELFDYICGVSTGSILVSCIGTPAGISLEQALNQYKEFGTKLFTQSPFWGVSNLLLSKGYYDTTMFEQLLKTFVGETPLTRTNRDAQCPKLSSISTVMNKTSIMPFVFRNYELPYNRQSQYAGGCNYTLYESVRASGAAPAVFQEFCLDGAIHHDGGISVNNPCAVALHEAKRLWPKSEIQCIVSCGTGRPIPLSVTETSKSETNPTSVSWKILFDRILDSATDTEAVHTMLNDLLPPSVYFRFNPYLTESHPMHEIRPEKISRLEEDTAMYIRKNEEKFVDAANTLLIPRTVKQKFLDYVESKSYKFGIKNITCKL